MTQQYAGVWPAMVTPLDETGVPNHDAIEKLVEVFVHQRLGGLYVLGSTGQWPLLSITERKAVAERTVKAAAGRIPVIIHVGAVAGDDAATLARHAATIGATAISCVAPIYYSYDWNAVFHHYRRVGLATELPLFIYHLAGVNQVIGSYQDYAERLLAVPHFAGMKITDRDLYSFGLIHSYTGGRYPLLSGADEVLCHAALSGAAGAVGSFYNVWGSACQTARSAFVNGSVETGRRFMLVFQRAIDDALRTQTVQTFLRSALRIKYGIDIGAARPPLGAADKPLSDTELAKLMEQVDRWEVKG